MKTVFRKGMKVYDSVFFPKSEGKVVEIDKHINYERVIVQFDCLDYNIPYTEQGRLTSTRNEAAPTLSTSPYTFQGFEQKAPAPTFEEAIEWLRENNLYDVSISDDSKATYFTKKENYPVFEALRRLVILRDYYNKGWQPDWTKATVKYCIEVYGEDLSIIDFQFKLKPMAFKTREIRDKFLEEQRELLEIAKPLL